MDRHLQEEPAEGPEAAEEAPIRIRDSGGFSASGGHFVREMGQSCNAVFLKCQKELTCLSGLGKCTGAMDNNNNNKLLLVSTTRRFHFVDSQPSTYTLFCFLLVLLVYE